MGVTERGDVTLGVLLFLALAAAIGWGAAKADSRHALCQAFGRDGLCLFGEVNDVATDVSRVSVLAPDQAPPGRTVEMSEMWVEGVNQEPRGAK